MRAKIIGIVVLWLAVLGLDGTVSASADPLQYRVVYRGVLSIGQDMPIADVELHEQALPDNPLVCRTYPFEAKIRGSESNEIIG